MGDANRYRPATLARPDGPLAGPARRPDQIGEYAGRSLAGGPRLVPDLVCMADVEPAEVPWLWTGRIAAGRITLLSGRPGVGKSFVTCDLAARVSTGRAWPDGGAAPAGGVLLLSAEDDPEDTIAPRLAAAGADRRRVHLLKAAKLVQASGEEVTVAVDLSNVGLIRDALDTVPGCKLVVVDPVGSYLGGRVDAHRDNEVRAVLAPLAALAADRGVAVVLVCHTRKAAAEFADDAVLGSRAFTGLARSVLHLSADDGDRPPPVVRPPGPSAGPRGPVGVGPLLDVERLELVDGQALVGQGVDERLDVAPRLRVNPAIVSISTLTNIGRRTRHIASRRRRHSGLTVLI